jgi:hypothetical protein
MYPGFELLIYRYFTFDYSCRKEKSGIQIFIDGLVSASLDMPGNRAGYK